MSCPPKLTSLNQGIIACGPTHTMVTPLDLVKTRRQVNPGIYKSNMQGWSTIFKGEGMRGVFTGWAPTLIGYSFQGMGKYGFYEVFKHEYGDNLFPNMNKTVVFLAASASAEFIADIFLCPFEALKVRMQTTVPPFASTLREAWGKTVAKEGIKGLYSGIVPLWGRQIPYTMCKFATFEETVGLIYAKGLGGKKEDYGKLAQTGVSFLGGYIAGIACAVVSHPADVMVSKLNSDRKGKFAPFFWTPVELEWPADLLSYSWRRCGGCDVQNIWQDWLHRTLERSSCTNRHDRHSDGVPMAYLRLVQGLPWTSYDWWTLIPDGRAASKRTHDCKRIQVGKAYIEIWKKYGRVGIRATRNRSMYLWSKQSPATVRTSISRVLHQDQQDFGA